MKRRRGASRASDHTVQPSLTPSVDGFEDLDDLREYGLRHLLVAVRTRVQAVGAQETAAGGGTVARHRRVVIAGAKGLEHVDARHGQLRLQVLETLVQIGDRKRVRLPKDWIRGGVGLARFDRRQAAEDDRLAGGARSQ